MSRQHIAASHRIELPVPADRGLRFFTPAGERLWVPGWAPRHLHPADGHTEAGMVFTTGTGDEFTIWCLVDWQPAQGRARYSRVTPALRAGTVEVRCAPIDGQCCSVDVSYTLTALTLAGEATLAAFEGAAYRQMIESWRAAIEAGLPALRAAEIP